MTKTVMRGKLSKDLRTENRRRIRENNTISWETLLSDYNLRLIYLKAYFNYCVERDAIEINPLRKFKIKRTESSIVDISPKDLQKMLDVFDLDTYIGLRDYALFLLQ